MTTPRTAASTYGHTGTRMLRAITRVSVTVGLLGLASAALDLGGTHAVDLPDRQVRAAPAVVAFAIALSLDRIRRRSGR